MLPAPNLDSISDRLHNVHLDPWGPDGVRYICILFWDFLGYRFLTNEFDRKKWESWSHSSGEFWDLFLAGCYMYAPEDYYGEIARPLTSGPKPPFYWNPSQSDRLAHEVAAAANHGGAPAWNFSGPLELVTVGARRDGDDVAIDWASLRFARLSTIGLSDAVSYYTEAHIVLDADIMPKNLPSPGDFEDNLPGELKRALIKHVGLLKVLLPHHAHGLT
jgi:hypothetical protein